jgi:hypothetical protein
VLGDALGLVFAADHEAARCSAGTAAESCAAGQFDEMGALERALAEQHAVVGQDGDRHSPRCGRSRRPGSLPYRGLELVELRAVDQPGDDLAHVIGGADVVGDDAVQFLGVIGGGAGFAHVASRRTSRGRRRMSTMVAHDGQRVFVILGEMIDDAGLAACRSPPPRSSALMTSPVAAFTSGGPARKMVPWFFTITVSSDMAGT